MNILNKIHTKLDLYKAVSNGYLTDEEAYNLIGKYPGNEKLNRNILKRQREDYINSVKYLNRKIVFYIQSNNNELGMLLSTKLSEYFNIEDNKPIKPYITDIADKQLNRIYNEYNGENSVIINNYDKNKDLINNLYFFKTSFEPFKKARYQWNVYKNKKLISNYYFLVNETNYENFIFNLTGTPDFRDSKTYKKYSGQDIVRFKSFNISAARRFNYVIELIENSNEGNYIVSICQYGDHEINLLKRMELKNFTLNYEDLNNKEISNNIKELGNYLLNNYDEFFAQQEETLKNL